MRRYMAALVGLALASQVQAEVPNVTTDIAPVHSLVAQVLGDLGQPELIVTPGASPHNFALRPSQARALEKADLIVWVGPGLTPWLSKAVESLSGDAVQLELLDQLGDLALGYRDLDDHSDHDGDEDHSGHDDHDDHTDDDDAHNDHDAHDHEGDVDPHAWLNPEIASLWLGVFADKLAELDPEHADEYRRNAQAAQAQLLALAAEIETILGPVQSSPVITFHDAYQYFETRFGLTSVGTLTLSDAATPSPAHLSRLKTRVDQGDVVCAFSEPQYDDRLIHVVSEGTGVPIAVLDPIGAQLEPGADLYGSLLRAMANAIADCAKH